MGKSSKNEKKSKKKHKHKERKEKKKSKKLKKQKDKSEQVSAKKVNTSVEAERKDNQDDDFAIPVELMNSKSHAPETPEEYQQRQNRIRREIDPTTGRSRLIKGDGEILEEIVSKDRHMAINKEATKGDGDFFQENTLGKLQ